MPRPLHALVVGGSRGIGLSIAQLLARNKYSITLLSRTEPALKVALATLNGQQNPSSFAGDITAPSFWTNDNFPDAYKLVGLHSRKIDVLVNCAGITQTELFQRMEASSIESVVNTNLTAMMVGTKYLLKNRYIYGGSRKESTHSPVIINVASLLGLRGGSGAVAYAASKAGVLGFTRALATEMGPLHVRVNAIVPGYIETDMTKDLNHDELIQRIPLGRFGKPEEIAQAALFLAQNEYAHNCVINLDGGLSAV